MFWRQIHCKEMCFAAEPSESEFSWCDMHVENTGNTAHSVLCKRKVTDWLLRAILAAISSLARAQRLRMNEKHRLISPHRFANCSGILIGRQKMSYPSCESRTLVLL